ncbi:penicillin-binding protein [Bacillus sp. BRMEA1]|uniref:penicillin-binding protein n=1 Tax=Neobacillus endophyticus TaxID=2738405 RepID=UPI00156345B4|nr:penicillin-binding protein [Neobacillus endophyticus]NRD78778.1 penicillin-binding protein [Neobacillus endophyticus]
MSKKQPYMNLGAAILFGFFVLLFFILIFRYFSIQITGEVAGQPMAAKALQKYTHEGVLQAVRGEILDRNGDVVAEDTASYEMIAILDKKMTTDPKHPQNVVNPSKTANELAKYIKMDESEIYRRLTEKKFQVEFGKAGKNLNGETKSKIEALKLPGITFIRDTKRYYPNSTFASNVVGYTDSAEQKDGTYENVGKMGIEQSFNDVLTGKNGTIHYESDLWGYLLPDGKEKITPARDGNDVYLTIDQKIQTFLEDAMDNVVKQYKPKKIIAIVADAKTGDILAMGQRPSFDPNTKDGINESWHNEAVETSYEPGSTMKIFTLSAAVQENLFNPNETYMSGSFQATPKSQIIHDWNWSGWGRITYLEGLQRSSNVAFATIARDKLGYDKLRDYISKFGLDKPTGIELPNEAAGKIAFTYPVEKATTAYGQGTAITPIEQIQAATAVANDGKMMKPHIVEKIVDHDTGKVIKEDSPEVAGTPISAETAKQVRDYLETVVTSPKGTGGRYKIDGYSVAGKTGTASIPGPNGQYLKGADNYVFSFLGMAPKDNPKLIVYVAVQQPDLGGTGQGALPVSAIFDPVMKNSLQYLNIKPSSQKTPSVDKLDDFSGQSVDTAVKSLKANGFDAVILGKGTKVVSQLPNPGTSILDGEKVILQTDGDITMPDLSGWSLRDVMKVTNLAGLNLNAQGKGYVTQQSIKPKTVIHRGNSLTVNLILPEDLYTEETKNQKGGQKNQDSKDNSKPK